MEPFVDFGLFEFIVATGIAWTAKSIYTKRTPAICFLAVSLLVPAALVFFSQAGVVRWIATGCLAISVVNAAVLFPLVWSSNLLPLLAKLSAPPQGENRKWESGKKPIVPGVSTTDCSLDKANSTTRG